MSLKNKGITGLIWASAEQFGNQIIQFVIGIILARLLEPTEFGLIGMLTIFVSVSEGIVSGGFVHALIRKRDVKEEDYNTAFYYNFIVSLFLYAAIFLASPGIASFYREPRLESLVKGLMLIVIINSFAFIQRALLIKNLNFKALAKASVLSQIVGGVAGVGAAYSGLGVWSLVIKMVLTRLINTIYLMILSFGIPRLSFSRKSFNELFGFGSRILLTQMIERLYQNIYLVVIGRFYSPAELGYYTRANMFKGLVTEQLTSVTQKVTMPLLSEIQDNEKKLKDVFSRLVRIIFFISAFLLIGLIPMAKTLILFLIGEKWLPSVPFLQLLAIAGILYPIGEINQNLLQVKGRADYILKLQFAKKLISLPIIILGVYMGLIYLVGGVILISVLDFFFSSYYSGRIMSFSSIMQLRKGLPYLLIFSFEAILIWLFTSFISNMNSGVILFVQIFFYLITSIILMEVFQIFEYREVKSIVMDYAKKVTNRDPEN